jgi:hypothetical protein
MMHTCHNIVAYRLSQTEITLSHIQAMLHGPEMQARQMHCKGRQAISHAAAPAVT